MKFTQELFLLLCGAFLTAGCAEEIVTPPAGELYAREFIKKYGIPDTKQDWNTFKSVKVELGGVNSRGIDRIQVLTAAPGAENSRLVADYGTDRSEFTIDLQSSQDRVFVVGLNSRGRICLAKEFPVKDGVVSLAGKARSRSVAGVTLSEPIKNFGIYRMPKEEGKEQEYRYYSGNLDAGDNETVENTESYPVLANNDLVTPERIYKRGDFEAYYLNGVVKEESDYSWYPWQCRELFGEGGMFPDGDNNFMKLAQTQDVWSGLGLTVTDETEPVYMQMMYSCTTKRNAFGYLYYVPKPGESQSEILEGFVHAPRYFLIEDGTAVNNLKYYNGDRTEHKPVRTELTDWYKSEQSEELIGSKYQLAYFGENYDQQAGEHFPKGTRIVFFISAGVQQMSTDQTGDRSNSFEGIYDDNHGSYLRDKDSEKYIGFHTRYSLPALNKYFNHMHGECRPPVSGHENDGGVYFMSYKWRGMTLMGVEDVGKDGDMNDIIFVIDGAEPDNIMINVPSDSEVAHQSAILACEDLGNSYDHDFNDLVLEVSHVAGQSKAHIRPLAAGGTLKMELFYNDKPLNGGKHINEWFGVSDHRRFLNVYGSITEPGETIEIDVDPDFRFAWAEDGKVNMSGFKVLVHHEDGVERHTVEAPYAENPGDIKYPQMILVDGSWIWPEEEEPIHVAYPDFKKWVADRNTTGIWDNVEGKLVDRSAIEPMVKYTYESNDDPFSEDYDEPDDPARPKPNVTVKVDSKSWDVESGEPLDLDTGEQVILSVSVEDNIPTKITSSNSNIVKFAGKNQYGQPLLEAVNEGTAKIAVVTNKTPGRQSTRIVFEVKVSGVFCEVVKTDETVDNVPVFKTLIPRNYIKEGANLKLAYNIGHSYDQCDVYADSSCSAHLFTIYGNKSLTADEAEKIERGNASVESGFYVLYLKFGVPEAVRGISVK